MKIAFLFLVITTLCHEDYWRDFFKEQDENRYSIYIHSKMGVPEDSPYKQHELPFRVATTWSHTMKAQIAMLREALKDPENAKFLFLSDSTIPLQCFDLTYNQMMSTDQSMFSYEPNPHQYPNNPAYRLRNLNRIPKKYRYKNFQWIVLNRKHAELMVQDSKYFGMICRYICDNEHYPSCFLAFKGLLHEVLPRDVTYVNWEKFNPPEAPNLTPFIFSDLTDPEQMSCITDAINKNYLFARKFPKSTDLSSLKIKFKDE